MATTIGSFHLLAVLAVALLTKSKQWTWIAAVLVLVVAFAVGNAAYDFMDAISTLFGLGIGLHLIGDAAPRPPKPSVHISPNPQPRDDLQPAQMFELHPPRRHSRAGLWAVAALALAAIWWWVGK